MRSLRLFFAIALLACLGLATGCGTTKWSDSPRTATEQMLISDAADRAISEIDFRVLSNQNVYLDTRYIATTVDQNYVVSTLRQHMLASGCVIKDKPDEAQYIVEVRTGSLGTNRQDLLFGVPATTLPTPGVLPSGGATIPEIALMKRTNQQGVCKIAVFAYDRMSGRPVWQSGNRKIASRAKDTWVLGAGPFQRGTIYEGTAFAGEKFDVPLAKRKPLTEESEVGQQVLFAPNRPGDAPLATGQGVATASYAEAAAQVAAQPAVPPDASARPAYTPIAPATPANLPYAPPPPNFNAPLPGPQGPLSQQTVLPQSANPAATTAGAIQTLNWAKEMVGPKR